MNIITYGTFDLFHIGHLNLLKRCKDLCEGGELIVGVSSDEFNKIKGKQTVIPYEERKQIVEAIKYVDKVICEDNREQKKTDIEEYNARLVMGDDWTHKFNDLGCVYISRTPGISTTEIKEFIKKEQNGAETKTKGEAENSIEVSNG